MLGFITGINAQQITALEKKPVYIQGQSNAQVDASLIKKENISNAFQYKKNSHKSIVNYSQPAYLSSLSFAHVETKDSTRAGGSINLFPDSLAFSYTEYTNVSSLSSRQVNFAATGFVFDPYSKSFDPRKQNGYYLTDNIFYGYKIDTIAVIVDYRIANYNPDSPDTLRFYVSSHDVYYPRTNFMEEYYTIGFDFYRNHRFGLSPVIDYRDPIPQKGSAAKPKVQDCLVFDYILSPDDSLIVTPGYILGKPVFAAIPDGGFEVKPASVASIIMEYLPGYDYNLDDTISKLTLTYNGPKNIVIESENINLNRLDVRTWDYNLYPDAGIMWDAYGYNSFLMEDMGIRYATEDTVDYGNGAMYSASYYSKPMFYVHVHKGDNIFCFTRIDTVGCSSFTYNDSVYTKSGVYEHVFTSISGEDSLVILNLAIYDNPGDIDGILGDVIISETGIYTYSISEVSDAHLYLWVLRDNDQWSIAGTGEDLQVAVNVQDTGSATLWIYAFHPNRVCFTKDSLYIETLPTMLGSVKDIQGDALIDQFGTYSYEVNPVTNAGSYQWEITGDNQWKITGEGNQISLNISDTGSGILSVKAYNQDSSQETKTVSLPIRYCFTLGAMEEIQGESLVSEFGTYTYSIEPVENAISYQWEVEAPWRIVGSNTGTTVKISINENTEKTLSVRAFNNCGREEQKDLTIRVDKVNVASYELKDAINIYPNPAKNNIYIVFEQEISDNMHVQLYDISGRLLKTQYLTDNSSIFELSSFSAGIYYLQIKKGSQIIKTEKLIKQ